ncbi:MAG: hypothetical protein J6O13_03375 [Selenomonas sp.]|nr:hypothetical protein [Anaerovibrio sp.]MBO6202550.1 hypothetical protein [Selenomonas sp.]
MAFNRLVTEWAGASCACPALAHPCASVAEFDERLWGAMVDYVTVGVDKRLTVMFRNGTGVDADFPVFQMKVDVAIV